MSPCPSPKTLGDGNRGAMRLEMPGESEFAESLERILVVENAAAQELMHRYVPLLRPEVWSIDAHHRRGRAGLRPRG
jgi:hypothetical protein